MTLGPSDRAGGVGARPTWLARQTAGVKVADPNHFAFAVFGDHRENPALFARVLDRIAADPEIRFALDTGDLVDAGKAAEYAEVLAVLNRHPHRPVFMVPGNHDVRGRGAQYWAQHFGPRCYDFRIGATAFIVADVPEAEVEPQQLAWLEATLRRHQGCERILVFQHQPLDDPRSGHGHAMKSKPAGALLDLYRRYHVTHLFTGHIHGFFQGHWGPIPFTITGGAGARLVAQKGPFAGHHYVKVSLREGTLFTTYVPLTTP